MRLIRPSPVHPPSSAFRVYAALAPKVYHSLFARDHTKKEAAYVSAASPRCRSRRLAPRSTPTGTLTINSKGLESLQG